MIDERTICSPLRKQLGRQRLIECYNAAIEPKMENAVAMMKLAVQRALAETDGQARWEDIFGSKEQMLYWLDDSNFEELRIQ